MKGNRYGYSLLIVISTCSLFSCSNQRASSLKKELDKQERKATDIVLSETGTESQKLEFLIAEQYDSALAVTARQQAQFDSIINDIKAFPADDLAGAADLKHTAVQYYSALQMLYGYSAKETQHQQLLERAAAGQQDTLQDGLLTLAKQKQALFQAVYKAEADFAKATAAFDKQYKL